MRGWSTSERLRYGPTMQVLPYPLGQVPKLSRTTAAALTAFRRRIARAELAAMQATAAALLGTTPQIRAGLPEAASPAQALSLLREPVVALLLEAAGASTRSQAILACTPSVAAALVDRTLGGDGSLGMAQGLMALDDMSQGVFAYLAARLLAASQTGYGLRSLMTECITLPDALAADGCIVLPLALRLGAQELGLTLLLPPAAIEHAADPAPSQLPEWLGALTVSLWADGGRAHLCASTLATLGKGDVIVLDQSGLSHSDDGFLGSVAVRLIGSGWRLRCQARQMRFSIEAVEAGKDPLMTTGKVIAAEAKPEASAMLISDAPIELGVELARFSLSLGELALLGPGDVLSTGRRIGEAVTLRSGDRALAEGELVDIDGETGVRILRMLVR